MRTGPETEPELFRTPRLQLSRLYLEQASLLIFVSLCKSTYAWLWYRNRVVTLWCGAQASQGSVRAAISGLLLLRSGWPNLAMPVLHWRAQLQFLNLGLRFAESTGKGLEKRALEKCREKPAASTPPMMEGQTLRNSIGLIKCVTGFSHGT